MKTLMDANKLIRIIINISSRQVPADKAKKHQGEGYALQVQMVTINDPSEGSV